MQQILNEGNNIGDWELKEITNLNPVYIEAEKLLESGYKMYNTKQFVEAFVLFMRFTKFYDIVCRNKELIISNKRHLNLKRNFTKIIPILEQIKPQLIEKYERKVQFPVTPKAIVKPVINDIDKSVLVMDLESRWQQLVPKPRPKPIPKPQNTKPEAKTTTKPKAKTTDDINIANTVNKVTDDSLSKKYVDNSGNPLDALSILRIHLKEINRDVEDVPGDNNCQFHAVADQLEKIGMNGWDHIKLRKKAVSWLSNNEKRPMDDGKLGEQTTLITAVGITDWKSYTDEMSKVDITWGDEATLLALSVLFKIEIVVVSSLPGNYIHSVKPPEFWNVDIQNKIYLGHYHEFHYVSTK